MGKIMFLASQQNNKSLAKKVQVATSAQKNHQQNSI